MAIYRAQIAFQYDSALPRDAIVVTPHYTGSDPQALADGLKANLLANTITATGKTFTINVYNAQGPPPHHPIGFASQGSSFANSANPREVSLCLSYYATKNQPRLRGRLYLPAAFFGGTGALRPTAGILTQALTFGPTFGKTLPSGVAWVVYSRKDDTARPVTNYWVDDEWDTVRSRGLKSLSRQQGTIP